MTHQKCRNLHVNFESSIVIDHVNAGQGPIQNFRISTKYLEEENDV